MTHDEFGLYFKSLAVKYPADDDYVKVVGNHFESLSEDLEAAVRNDEIQHTIFLLRQRLLTLSNNNQEEYKLRDMFRKFDTDQSGALSIHELKGMLG